MLLWSPKSSLLTLSSELEMNVIIHYYDGNISHPIITFTDLKFVFLVLEMFK
jgi:hypothetical protein